MVDGRRSRATPTRGSNTIRPSRVVIAAIPKRPACSRRLRFVLTTSNRSGPPVPIGATSLSGLRAPGRTAGMPIAAPRPAAAKVQRAPATSTRVPPTMVPSRTENRIVPPISDIARPRSRSGIRRVRSAWRDSITPSAPAPNTKWPSPKTTTVPLAVMTAAEHTMATREPAPTLAGPHRSVAQPTGSAPVAAPAPPAPATMLATAYPWPSPTRMIGNATRRRLMPRLADIQGP